MSYRKINHKLIARTIGVLMMIIAASTLFPLGVSLATDDGAFAGLLGSSILTASLGMLFFFGIGRNASYKICERDSFWATGLVWLSVPIIGALPYLFSGEIDRFTDALFESVSGFSTTGSSIIPHPEKLPPSILLWRSMTQWFGGLGLILLIVMLMKRLNTGSSMLYNAEFSGGMQKKLHPHMSTSVRLMWITYCFFTIVLMALLIACGNRKIDSICLALSTVSTGGFMPDRGGLNIYNSQTLSVLGIAMFLAGLNIALLYKILFLKWKTLQKNEEARIYIITFLFAATIATLSLLFCGNGFSESAGFALLHISSTLSTCGFVYDQPANSSRWVSVITFCLILAGACTGSTGGGVKLKRLIIIFKYVQNYLIAMIHPAVVTVVTIDNERVQQNYINKIFAFVFMYIMLLLGGAFMLTLCDISIHDSLCIAEANLSNIGPSMLINNMGAGVDYTLLPDLGKWTLMGLMLAGRLEIFALLAIFSPQYWKQR